MPSISGAPPALSHLSLTLGLGLVLATSSACGTGDDGDSGGSGQVTTLTAAGTLTSATSASGTTASATATATAGDGDGDGDGDASATASAGDGDAEAGDGDGDGDGGGASIAVCQQACVGVEDCVVAGSPLNDADNYDCVAGTCTYLGCNNSDECIASSAGDVCAANPNFPEITSCAWACVIPEDCPDYGPTSDLDNWACEGGICVGTGCNSDSECQTIAPNYGCFEAEVPYCQVTCSTPFDCAFDSPGYTEEHWACEAGFCTYLGCVDEGDCPAGYVCTQPGG